MKITGLNCAFVLIACTCLTPAAYADGVKGAIEAANGRFSAAAAKGDGAALAALSMSCATRQARYSTMASTSWSGSTRTAIGSCSATCSQRMYRLPKSSC
jgi:hypothetical protein